MPATKTVAAYVLVLGTLVASSAKAERIGDRSWRWTSWSIQNGIEATNLTNLPIETRVAAPVAPTIAAAPTAFVIPQAPITQTTAPITSFVSTDNWQNSTRFATTNPNPTDPTPKYVPAPVQPTADAFINLGTGPYAGSDLLTTGGAQPWYNSSVVEKLYGGSPNDQQRAAFSSDVLGDVKQLFSQSGLQDLNITTDPNVGADHTMSVVSGTSYGGNSDAIGITNVGHDGFSFIDKLDGVKSVDELSQAVAHNVTHELMHAFGVAEHPDQTGKHIDAAAATWQSLTDPDATLSPEAVRAILAHEPENGLNATTFSLAVHVPGDHCALCQVLASQTFSPTPVPEPTTIALWSIVGLVGVISHRRSKAAR